MRRFVVVASFLFAVAGCRSLGPGETECGSVVCSAGQYCFGGGICSNGCTSDANCLEGSRCENIDEVTGQGTCSTTSEPKTNEPDPEPQPVDAEASCNASIDRFQECGMTAADAADARRDCNDVTEDQAAVLENCAEMSCGDLLSCLGLDCFVDDHCAAGETCVGNACL